MTSPQIALIRLLFEGRDLPENGPVAELARAHPEGVARARALVAQGLDAPDTPEATATLFDRLAAEAPEAGMALYSLGSPALLEAATAELVAVVAAWTPFANARVLDLGCGIGRVAEALAARGAEVTGLDVSPGVLAEAARRSAGRVQYVQGSGRDLRGLPDGGFELVLAADSFPYIVAAGLTGAMLAEIARVLRPGGALIVFNWSYRGDLGRDAAEAAQAPGFRVERSAEQPFAIWDAAGFLLRRC